MLPEYQREGYGKRLVKWGLDRALDQGIAARAITANINEVCYRKFGFDVEVGNIADGEMGGTILFGYPKSDARGDSM